MGFYKAFAGNVFMKSALEYGIVHNYTIIF